MKSTFKVASIAVAAVLVFSIAACSGRGGGSGGSGSGGGEESGGGEGGGGEVAGGEVASVETSKSIASAEELKEYLGGQSDSSPDNPIQVTMSANDQMLKDIAAAIKASGKHVSLTLTGNELTAIPNFAFRDLTNLAGIALPDSVTSIGNGAFQNCTGLAPDGVIIPKSVTSAAGDAFAGTTGPGGGKVFYYSLSGFAIGAAGETCHFIEAAPAGTEFITAWGPYTNVAGTRTGVGSGKRNTELIVAALGTEGSAARRCARLNVNGHNDWFLPSKDELNLMYRNLKLKGFGGFDKGWYWSSSQDPNFPNDAWHQRFNDGDQDSDYKVNDYSVRAVRAF